MKHNHGIISIEGVEGVGKSTCLKFIKEFFEEIHKTFITTREPGGTSIAEDIRNIILKKYNENLDAKTELLLMFASRNQHIKNVIIPALNSGKWVITDRFVDSSYAYQGGGRNIDKSWIQVIDKFIVQDLKPKITFLLRAENIDIKNRLMCRDYLDRIETEEDDFFNRVKNSYSQRCKEDPLRFFIINSSKSLHDIREEVFNILRSNIAI